MCAGKRVEIERRKDGNEWNRIGWLLNDKNHGFLLVM